MTRTELLLKMAYQDYEAAKGRIFLATELTGYVGGGDTVDVLLDPPARVRVIDDSTGN